MKNSKAKTSLVRVICERCSHSLTATCRLCGGQRYYLWDPLTFLCYSFNYKPLVVTNDKGDSLPVIRESQSDTQTPAIESMIKLIEWWVSESAVRKWKLTCDEDGWHSCLWINRYKKTCYESSHRELRESVLNTYNKVILISKSPSKRA